MPRNLSIAQLGVALCSSVTWAQSTQDSVPPNDAKQNQIASFSTTESADKFELFQHGFWPHNNRDTTQRTPPSAAIQVAGDSNSRSKFRLSRTAASRRAIYLPSIQAAEKKHRLPSGLLDALIWQESRYNPMAVSSAGAGGLTQLMPGTASDLGVRNRFDPAANIDGGARYLQQMLKKFGKVHLALAAYNAGPGAVERTRGIPRNGETPDYVRKVLGRWTESRR